MIKNSNHTLLQDIAYTVIINFDNFLEHAQITWVKIITHTQVVSNLYIICEAGSYNASPYNRNRADTKVFSLYKYKRY